VNEQESNLQPATGRYVWIPESAAATETPVAVFHAAPTLLAACEADAAYAEHAATCPICAPPPVGGDSACENGLRLGGHAYRLRTAAIAKAKGQ
jgi:hypothetical protein